MIGRALVLLVGFTASWGTLSHAQSQQDTREARVFPALAHVVASGEDGNGLPYTSSGTAFVTSSSGHLLTAAHILDPLSTIRAPTLRFSITVNTEKDNLDAAAIVFRDTIADVLVLKLPTPVADRKFLCVLPKKDESGLKINDTQIFSSGFPAAVPYINTHGLIATFDGPGNTWLTDLPIYDGQSGSPVYTASGQVIGVAKGQQQSLPGMYAFIPVPNIRSQIMNFTSDCAVENVNISAHGPQLIDPKAYALPAPSECVFLGKQSALTTEKPEDSPFGIATLRQLIEQKLANTGALKQPKPISPRVTVNVRSNCPVVRGTSAYYGSVVGQIGTGQTALLKSYLALDYAEDIFYWGQVSPL